METNLVAFKDKLIRRMLIGDEWHFVVVDVIAYLTGSDKSHDYWNRMKKREAKSSKVELSAFCRELKLVSTDGKEYLTEMANTEGIFRIIQSISSPKAEALKRRLAKVGYERMQEIEDPELALKRTRELYQAKGYSDAWIEKRMREIAVRAELTEEWKKRNVKGEPEYAILTSEISKAAFGMTPGEYKKLKGLDRQNLSDHMTDLELIFSMLGEAATTEIARKQDAKGFAENKVAARKGGRISGEAREKLETETGESVITPENYLLEPEGRKRLARKRNKKAESL